jgi:purine-binding chemotaxis protein CheW
MADKSRKRAGARGLIMSIRSPQDSLQNYFDDLLLVPDTENARPLAPQPQIAVKQQEVIDPDLERYEEQLIQERLAQQKLAKLLASAAAVEAQPKIEVEAVVTAESVVAMDVVETIHSDIDPADEIDESLEAETLESLKWLENGRPCWAQNRFEVLLFSVSGLTLAVPLISLGQIQPITDELTPLFGQVDWFMGLQPTPVGKIRTINTAKFVMPERYDEAFLKTAKYVVSIDGLPWGLAVDAVNQPISLEPEDVNWRSERSKRAWLAGTVKEHMCALIDIPMMGQMLQDADRSK